MAELTGTGRLADDLYLMAHDDYSGKPHLQRRALGIGLAGGLLAELALRGAVAVSQGVIVPADRGRVADGLTRSVYDLIAGEPEQHPVRTWLQFLGRTSADDIAGRLELAGYLTQAGGRGLRRTARWVPVDSNCAFAALLRARAVLDADRPVTTQAVTLAGLAAACGLAYRLSQPGPARSGRTIEELVRHLSPGLRELIAQTQAAVDSALLSQRA